METLINTDKCQLRSLLQFALKLGYTYETYPGENKKFYSVLACNKHRSNISFRTMVALHNKSMCVTDWQGNYKAPFDFDFDKVDEALKSKICEKVFLQYSKKKNAISVQRDLLKFTSKENIEKWLGEEYA